MALTVATQTPLMYLVVSFVPGSHFIDLIELDFLVYGLNGALDSSPESGIARVRLKLVIKGE